MTDDRASDQTRIRQLESALAAAKAEHRATLNEVDRLARHVQRMASSLNALQKQFTVFVEDDQHARKMQLAQTALIDVRAQRDRKFGHYETVRRGTIGMLQAMDAGIVTQSALQQAAERLMIDTPGYWLAPAQVALAAWISNSEELANKALLQAMARDPNKTALFFCLVLARHERWEATRKWMFEYVGRQDYMKVSREFTVVLDATAQGTLGEQTLRLVKEHCISWYHQLASADGIVKEQSRRWQEAMREHQQKLTDQFTVLPRMCPDWGDVGKWLEVATTHEQTEQWLRTRLEATELPQDGPRQRVDRLLRNLVTAYDQDEDQLRQLETEWANVVKSQGRSGTGRIGQSGSPEHMVSDFLTLLTTIGLTPEKVEASSPTRQFAIRLAADWISNAAHEITAKSRDDHPRAIKVRIGGWTGELTPDGNYMSAGHSFISFVDQQVDDEVGRVKITDAVRNFASVLTVAILIPVVLAFRVSAYPFLGSADAIAVGLLVWTFIRLRRAQRVLPKRRAEVRQEGEARKDTGLANLREASDEVRKVFEIWEAKLAKESSLVDFLQEQATQADPMSVPAINARSSSVAAVEAPRGTAWPGILGESGERSPDSDEPFAFELPSWDLMPPPNRIAGATSI